MICEVTGVHIYVNLAKVILKVPLCRFQVSCWDCKKSALVPVLVFF